MTEKQDQMDLKSQVQDAMNQLLKVSSTFKDLQPGADKNVSTREETIAMMRSYLRRLELDTIVQTKLSVIHVAGTKGKGSTCAMTERILREAGYKTGLFTSPHLITPCERFRINGKPIKEEVFLENFWAIWHHLEKTHAQSEGFPPMAWFFRFLTLLALRVFIKEQVDVVILEVGLGGRLDATNVIEKPVVCGITTLDLDHTRVLGNTIDLIAYAKAGIFKPGVKAFTSPQEPLAMEMLKKCAQDTRNPLFLVPSFNTFGPDVSNCKLGMQGDYQQINAALAVALASTWIEAKTSQSFSAQQDLDYSQLLTPTVRAGLKQAFWPARSHLVRDLSHQAAYYIDGAHTLKSLECCVEWYNNSIANTNAMDAKRVLIFNIHHERNVVSVLKPLLAFDRAVGFDHVFFCPTGAVRPTLAKVPTFSEALEEGGCQDLLAIFSQEQLQALDDVEGIEGKLKWQETIARLWRTLRSPTSNGSIEVKNSSAECMNQIQPRDQEQGKEEKWSVLVTGSLYLAGEALEYLKWSE